MVKVAAVPGATVAVPELEPAPETGESERPVKVGQHGKRADGSGGIQHKGELDLRRNAGGDGSRAKVHTLVIIAFMTLLPLSAIKTLPLRSTATPLAKFKPLPSG